MTKRRITAEPTGSISTGYAWSAVEVGYDKGDPIGYGSTEQEAIDELLDQLDEPT